MTTIAHAIGWLTHLEERLRSAEADAAALRRRVEELQTENATLRARAAAVGP